jgi:HSP20 family molecular chaperone IbpA
MATRATTRRTDEQIRWAVLAELEWDTSVGPHDIAVTVEDGVVTLGGWVDAYTTRSAAVAAVRLVAGVRAIVDEMELRRSSQARPTSAVTAGLALRSVSSDILLPIETSEIAVAGANLYEQDHRYILQVPLPGIKQEQVTIDARDNLVTLQGAIEFAAPKGARAIFKNAGDGQFYEVVALPGDVAAEHATVRYQDGVLTLTLPKAQHAYE